MATYVSWCIFASDGMDDFCLQTQLRCVYMYKEHGTQIYYVSF